MISVIATVLSATRVGQDTYREELRRLAPTPEDAVKFFEGTHWYPDQLARTLQDVYGIGIRKARKIAASHSNPPSRPDPIAQCPKCLLVHRLRKLPPGTTACVRCGTTLPEAR